MADSTPSSSAKTAPVKTAAWTATRVLIFLVVLSRGYQMMIALEIVPDFPDPVLKTVSGIYSSFDAVISEGLGKWGNVVLGNLVFGIVTRICSVPAREVVKAGKKNEEGKKVVKKAGKWKPIRDEVEGGDGDIDVSIGMKKGSMMKKNVFIWARVTQCVGLLVKNWEEGKKGEVVVRGVDLLVTLVIVGLELRGVKWDGGVVETVVALVRGPKVEKAVEEKKENGEVDGVKLKLR